VIPIPGIRLTSRGATTESEDRGSAEAFEHPPGITLAGRTDLADHNAVDGGNDTGEDFDRGVLGPRSRYPTCNLS
jgi:hypothetical protein